MSCKLNSFKPTNKAPRTPHPPTMMDTNQKLEIFRNKHRNRNMTQEVQPRIIYLQQKRVMRSSASWLLSIFQLVFGGWGFWVWSNITISICRLVDLGLPQSSKPVSLSPPMVKLTFSISGTWKKIFRWNNRVQLLNSTVKELPQNLSLPIWNLHPGLLLWELPILPQICYFQRHEVIDRYLYGRNWLW